MTQHEFSLAADAATDFILYPMSDERERERMAAYRFGGLEGTLLRLGESGQMSMIG